MDFQKSEVPFGICRTRKEVFCRLTEFQSGVEVQDVQEAVEC